MEATGGKNASFYFHASLLLLLKNWRVQGYAMLSLNLLSFSLGASVPTNENGSGSNESGISQQDGFDNNIPMSSRGEPKGPPQACLFVASLSPDTQEDTLHDHFSQYGEVLKIKLMKDRSSRPYAFVQFLVRLL